MDLVIHNIRGGMHEYQLTGIYPNYLEFRAVSLKKTWKHKLKSETKFGDLIFHGKIIYKYIYNNGICKVQKVVNGIPSSEWIEVQVMTLMRD
jgi:hypothetical protein